MCCEGGCCNFEQKEECVCVGAAQRKRAVSRLGAFEPEKGNTPSLLLKEGISSGHFGEGKVWR